MNREHLAKLESSPVWADAFNRHLAKAESLNGEGSYDAQAYAAVAADLEVSESDEAEGARAQREAQILADHRARQAVEAARPATTPAPAPDPGATAKAGWGKAVAQANANMGDNAQPIAKGEPAKAVTALLDEQDQRAAMTPPDVARSGWAKAMQEANAERGV